jgi:hypothetical protein
MRHAIGVSHGKGLRDASAKSVSDDASRMDVELVEQLDDAGRMSTNVEVAPARPITPPVAEEIEHNDAVAGRHERDDVVPQMP